MAKDGFSCHGYCNDCNDKCRWFLEVYPRESMSEGPEEEITDEDVWYALTDGMYGDYPGGSVDPDMFGF